MLAISPTCSSWKISHQHVCACSIFFANNLCQFNLDQHVCAVCSSHQHVADIFYCSGGNRAQFTFEKHVNKSSRLHHNVFFLECRRKCWLRVTNCANMPVSFQPTCSPNMLAQFAVSFILIKTLRSVTSYPRRCL